MTPKLITYSISKDSLIIEYSIDSKEIIAIIEPYTASTYFIDCGIAQGRDKNSICTVIKYQDQWLTWREFIIEARFKISEAIEEILIRHIQT
jgi:hypothetical protein